METRANYLLVGGFVVVMALGTLAFVVWLAKVQWDVTFDRYELVFEGSVTGLAVGSPVRYSGVRVGEVSDIRLDPETPSRVLVTVDVQERAPVKADTLASLELAGLTGGRYVLLSGGTPGADKPQPAPGQDYPRLGTKSSSLERVLEGAPDALASMNRVLLQAERLLSPQNVDAASRVLANTARATDRLDGLMAEASGTFANLNDATAVVADLVRDLRAESGALAERTEAAMRSLERLADSAESNVAQTGASIRTMVDESRSAAQSINRMAGEINAMVAENREPLRDFTANGLYELANLLNETRELVSSLNRVTTEVQRDPARFLFGDPQEGYEARQ